MIQEQTNHVKTSDLTTNNSYLLCLLKCMYSLPLNVVTEAEQIVFNEYQQIVCRNVYTKVSLAVTTIAALQFVCTKHNVSVSFDDFINRLDINKDSVNKMESHI